MSEPIYEKYGGQLVFEESDAFGTVQVVDREKIRALHFGTPTEQSSMFIDKPFDLEMEYIRTMALGLIFKPDAKKALCLGMGGGSLPKFIWKYFPECYVTVVELSPLVIDAAKRFFHVPVDPRLSIVEEEALRFLRAHPVQEDDLILVDLYVSGGIAPSVAEEDFFKCCDARLKPGGVLICDMWRSTSKDILEGCLQNLCDCFGRNLLILPNQESSNFIVIAFKEPIGAYTKERIETETKRLTEGSQVDFVKMLTELKFFKGYGYLFQDWS